MSKPTIRVKAITAPALKASSHFGASDAREFALWPTSNGSADSDLLPELGTLRSRSRDLGRNNGIAGGAHQTLADNIVGTGPRLSSIPDYRRLGKDKQWAEDWSSSVESLFAEWWHTSECDAAGQLDGAGLSTQVFRGAMVNGDGLALPLWLPRKESRWKTRLQIVESDRLSTPMGQRDTDTLRGGVEIDTYGRPLAYWVAKSHPGEFFTTLSQKTMDWERIPAVTGWGRRRVIHVHDAERSGQPLLSPVIGQFRMLDQYQRTEVQAAVVSAMIAAFLETPLSNDALQAMFGGGEDAGENALDYMARTRDTIAPLKGAAIIPVPPGTKMTPFNPARPNAQYDPFTTAICRHIAAAVGIPYELLLKDFSRTNYSSARAALLEAWRFFLGRRKWVTSLWLAPVYDLWLEEAIGMGLVDAPDFYEYRYAYTRARWIWPGRGWVDPVKEADAAVIRMDAGLTTLEDECAEQGRDWEEGMDQRAAEIKRAMEIEKEYGLPEGSLSKLPARNVMAGSPYPSDAPTGKDQAAA